MGSDPNRNVGCTDLSSELGSVPEPRETDPTPAVTRPSCRTVLRNGNPVTSARRSIDERQYITADKPEVTASYISQEVTTSLSTLNTQTLSVRTRIMSFMILANVVSVECMSAVSRLIK